MRVTVRSFLGVMR